MKTRGLYATADYFMLSFAIVEGHRRTDRQYFSTMIIKAMQLMGSCINTKTKPKKKMYTK